MQQITPRFMVLIVAVLLGGCLAHGMDRAKLKTEREFYAQPVSERIRTFRMHSLEDQLDLYYFGNQFRHPPATYLAGCFALNGKSAVELLRSKLDVDGDDLTVRDIAMLLATIDAMGKYDVAADAQLMTVLKSRVSKMRDDGWRDSAERKVASIGHARSDRADAASECG